MKNRFKITGALTAILAAVLLLTACGGAGGGRGELNGEWFSGDGTLLTFQGNNYTLHANFFATGYQAYVIGNGYWLENFSPTLSGGWQLRTGAANLVVYGDPVLEPVIAWGGWRWTPGVAAPIPLWNRLASRSMLPPLPDVLPPDWEQGGGEIVFSPEYLPHPFGDYGNMGIEHNAAVVVPFSGTFSITDDRDRIEFITEDGSVEVMNFARTENTITINGARFTRQQ